MIPQEYLGPYIVSNVISVGLIVTAIKWPRLTRVLFVTVFLAASLVNAYTALTEPELYLDYAGMTVLGFYRNFIEGFFSKHTQTIVLAIALGQLSVGSLLVGGDRLRRIGVIGGIVFLVAIAPLGVGSAFPATLLMTAALVLMERRLVQLQAQTCTAPHQGEL